MFPKKVATVHGPVKVDEQTLKGNYALATVRLVAGWASGVPMKIPLPLKLTEYKMPKEHHWGKRRDCLQECISKHGAPTKAKQG